MVCHETLFFLVQGPKLALLLIACYAMHQQVLQAQHRCLVLRAKITTFVPGMRVADAHGNYGVLLVVTHTYAHVRLENGCIAQLPLFTISQCD